MTGFPEATAKPIFLANTGAADTAVVHTITAVAAEAWVVDWVCVGYNAAPNPITLAFSIDFGGTTKFLWRPGVAGTIFLPFTPPLWTGTKNEEVVLTLPAGGVGVSGFVSVRYR